MGYWDYKNVGASTKSKNIDYVKKIFEYIGYAEEPDYAPDGEECSFKHPEVYCCEYSADDGASGDIKKDFTGFSEKELLYLLNALFPKTNIYVHRAEGNNTSDTWENHDEIFDTECMTLYKFDSYTDWGGGGPNGKRTSKTRFALKPPRLDFVEELIKYSEANSNTRLMSLLKELAEKLRKNEIMYEDDAEDKRIIGEEYDIVDDVEGEEDDYYSAENDEENNDENDDIEVYERTYHMDEVDHSHLDENLVGYMTDVRYSFDLDMDAFESIKSTIISWAKIKGYDLSLKQEDDVVSFFGKLGIDGVEPDDEKIWFWGEFKKLPPLGYPFLKLLSLLAPYAYNEKMPTMCMLKCDEWPITVTNNNGKISVHI